MYDPFPYLVGYNNVQLRSGSKMVGVSFDKVAGGKLDLCDLKVTGYEDLTDIFGNDEDEGVSGEFIIYVLNKNGGTAIDGDEKDMKYSFFHDWADGDWDGQPYWKQAGKVVSTGKVSFGPGDGLWFQVNSYAYTTEQKTPVYTLQNAGQAVLESRAVKLRSGSTGVGVTLSAAVDLLDLKIKGYEDLTDIFGNDEDEGVSGEFIIYVLNKNGGTDVDGDKKDMKYSFFHDWAEGDWDGQPYWKQAGKVVSTRGKVTFNPGDGLWVQVNSYAYTTEADPAPVYTLEFPGIDDPVK